MRLKDELDKEREERNHFQLERDKINTFWEITKKQLEEAKALLRGREREMEEVEERHAVEIKVRAAAPYRCLVFPTALVLNVALPSTASQVYKQKVKHLLYEHQNQIAELKAEGTALLMPPRFPGRFLPSNRLICHDWWGTAAMGRKMLQEDLREEASMMRRDKRSLKVDSAVLARAILSRSQAIRWF